jgi:hypothetical protein
MSYSNTSLPRIVCHITSLGPTKNNLLFNTKVLSYFSTKNMSYSNTKVRKYFSTKNRMSYYFSTKNKSQLTVHVHVLFNTKVLSYFSTKNMSYSNTSLPRIVCHYQEYYCTSLPRIWRRRFRSFVYTPSPSTNNLPTV